MCELGGHGDVLVGAVVLPRALVATASRDMAVCVWCVGGRAPAGWHSKHSSSAASDSDGPTSKHKSGRWRSKRSTTSFM